MKAPQKGAVARAPARRPFSPFFWLGGFHENRETRKKWVPTYSNLSNLEDLEPPAPKTEPAAFCHHGVEAALLLPSRSLVRLFFSRLKLTCLRVVP